MGGMTPADPALVTETISLTTNSASGAGGWWARYSRRLAESGIGETSRRVIEADARHVVDEGVLGAGPPADPRWPAGRVRTGAVMGAVQSGKTASMLAVTALALDAGVDAVVVLGGTRTALWLQTADRLLSQVDVPPEQSSERVMRPERDRVETGVGLQATSAYAVTSQQATRAAARGRPFIGVVMKNAAHLAEMSRSLHEQVYPAAEKLGRAVHLLVIDDEADDASVVDAESADPAAARQVPRRIRDLWERRSAPGETARPFLHATYLAYTATPQATFLQDPDNPLSPRDFFASLRTPGPEGNWRERSSSYRVPEGPRAWYTGGEIYYRKLSGAPLCLPADPCEDACDQVVDAVRAFLVASAIRVMRRPDQLAPVPAAAATFTSAAEADTRVVGPFSMLVHPSSAMEHHFDVAATVYAWAAGVGQDSGRAAVDAGRRALALDGIRADMDAHPDRWSAWLDSYAHSAHVVADVMEFERPRVPADDWPQVARTILELVVPVTSLAVINSDVNADDRPAFSPQQHQDGTWGAARNLSTIFVSGNVMSRGLTLEGLTTTFFSRRADEPLADTQMQMQRWFGYRGAYIDLCRVVMTAEQLALFERYHDDDEALRRDVLEAMRASVDVRPPLAVLQSGRYRATGKIANLRTTPLWPGPKPVIRRLLAPRDDVPNQDLIAELFTKERRLVVPPDTGRQGLLLERRLDLQETAGLLDKILAPPGVDQGLSAVERWASVENHVRLGDGDPSWPLLRIAVGNHAGHEVGVLTPQWIAAYLRLWAAALDRHIPGMISTDDLAVPWTLVDLDTKRQQQPRFSIGLRFGSGDVVSSGPLSSLGVPVRGMRRDVKDDQLVGGWGSRGVGESGIAGDECFDLKARGLDVRGAADGERPVGSDGQLLFHVVQREHGGVSLALGAVIPLGGPTNSTASRGGMSRE